MCQEYCSILITEKQNVAHWLTQGNVGTNLYVDVDSSQKKKKEPLYVAYSYHVQNN